MKQKLMFLAFASLISSATFATSLPLIPYRVACLGGYGANEKMVRIDATTMDWQFDVEIRMRDLAGSGPFRATGQLYYDGQARVSLDKTEVKFNVYKDVYGRLWGQFTIYGLKDPTILNCNRY